MKRLTSDSVKRAHPAVADRTSRDLGLGISSFIILAGVVPLTLAWFPGAPVTGSILAHYLVVAYASGHLAVLLKDGTPRWIDTTFWSFVYIWMGVAGLAQRFAGRNPFHIHIQDSYLFWASVVTLCGLVAYDFGSLLSRSKAQPVTSMRPRLVSEGAVSRLTIVAVCLTPLLVVLLGGFDTLLLSRTERFEVLVERGLYTDVSKVRGGILTPVTYALPLVALIGALTVWQITKKSQWALAILILAPLTVLIGNPIANSRYWSGTILLSLLLSMKWPNTRIGYRCVSIGTIVSLLVLFPYADYFRYRNVVEARGRSLTDLLVNKLDFDAPLQLANTIGYVSEHGTTGGHQFLGVLGFFVPRSLWPEKPGSTGSILSASVGFSQSNVSSPLWAEAYIDGGILAVLVVFVALGFVTDRLQRLNRASAGSKITMGVFITPIVASYGLIVLRGSLLSSASGFVVLLGLSWLVTKPKAEDGLRGWRSTRQPVSSLTTLRKSTRTGPPLSRDCHES